MTTSKNINRICVIITAIAVLVTVLFMNAKAFGVSTIDTISFEYETSLFDDSYVHTIDITIDDWDGLIENATSEEYSAADVTIDGETVKNVGIRAKGNTSLSTVSQLDSERYSFKIEFDAYETSGNYQGLDKLCLNNLIQDYTMMKDYITYKLMNEFGVASPLVSYCFITVNGEDWGLYLAVEAVEDSFLERNYGTNYGELYKPDTMSMGGGRGNGGDFDMKNVDFDKMGMKNPFERNDSDSGSDGDSEGGFPGGGFPGGGFGMGSSDAKIQYIDDDTDSYSTIFDSAKTTINKSDKKRLISSIKSLNEGIEEGDSEKIESAIDTDALMRYMVVHNFVVNGDSYTGSMIHNYYLYEEDGLMTMLPWDYNLAFGTFQADDTSSAVNDPIDTPLSVTEESNDRPMFSWITSSEEYTEEYHALYQEFLDQFYTSGYLTDLIDTTYEMLHDYVDRDPTKFCTTEEFETAVDTIRQFVTLRCESIEGQLDGTIPSTDSGQEADSSNLVDASAITLSDMGSMGGGMGGGPGGSGGPGGNGGHGSHDENSQDGSGENAQGGDNSTGDEKTVEDNGSNGSALEEMSSPESVESTNSSESTDTTDSSGSTNNSDSANNNFPGGNFPGGNGDSGSDSADGNNFPGGNGGPGGDFPGGDFGQMSSVSTTDYIYAGGCAAAILAAIAFAFFFKRKRLHI